MFEDIVVIFARVRRLHVFEMQHMYMYGGSEYEFYYTLWTRIYVMILVVHGLTCN